MANYKSNNILVKALSLDILKFCHIQEIKLQFNYFF